MDEATWPNMVLSSRIHRGIHVVCPMPCRKGHAWMRMHGGFEHLRVGGRLENVGSRTAVSLDRQPHHNSSRGMFGSERDHSGQYEHTPREELI